MVITDSHTQLERFRITLFIRTKHNTSEFSG